MIAPPPGLSFFGVGSTKGDEPRRAVLMTWAIAQGMLFVGTLDAVAPIISCFFCLSYAATNFTCFLLKTSGAINFRPLFTWFSWHTALLGTALNLGVMIWIEPTYAFASLALLSILVLYLVAFGPRKDWGEVSQALLYHQV